MKLLNAGYNYYEIKCSNIGGMPMPLIFEFEFTDGSKEKEMIPAEIWRYNAKTVKKVFVFDKELKSISLDPNLETADINRSNNFWGAKMSAKQLELSNKPSGGRWYLHDNKENPMQRAKHEAEMNK